MEKLVIQGKWVTLEKMGHQGGNGLQLEKCVLFGKGSNLQICVTKGKIVSRLENFVAKGKMVHIWVRVKWATFGKVGHTLKKWVTI